MVASIVSCRILIQDRSGSMYMGETKPHKKLSAMPVLLLVWLPYDVITLDSFTLKSNRGQAIQQCFRNMFTGIPTAAHFWHIKQNTQTKNREKISYRHNNSRWSSIIGIDCRRTYSHWPVIGRKNWYQVWYNNLFSIGVTHSQSQSEKRCQRLIGRLDQMCLQFWNNLCF